MVWGRRSWDDDWNTLLTTTLDAARRAVNGHDAAATDLIAEATKLAISAKPPSDGSVKRSRWQRAKKTVEKT